MNDRPILGFENYSPQAAAADTAEPRGLFGPWLVEAQRAEGEFCRRLMQEGGLRHFATADPEAFAEMYPNVVFMGRA
jgi:hypothetical protein